MKKYRIKVRKTKNGRVLDEWENTIESGKKPKVGEGWSTLTENPVRTEITDVKEINEDEKV